jgi:hypothetical protein
MKWGMLIRLVLVSLVASGCIESLPETMEVEWSKTYGERCMGYSFEEVDDGYIIGGVSYGDNVDGLLMKIDEKGEELWKKTYTYPGEDLVFSVHATGDGYMIFEVREPADEESRYEIWMIKTDKMGEPIWEKPLEIGEEYTVASTLQTADGYMAVGYEYRYPGESNIALLGTDTEGENLSEIRLAIEGNDMGRVAKEIADGYVIGAILVTETESSPLWDILFIKIDREGTVEWSHSYDYSDNDWLVDIHPVADGYLLLGYTSMKEDQYLDYGGDYLLIKTDENGKELWTQTYGHNSIEPPATYIEEYMDDQAFSLIVTKERYVISGYAFTKEDGNPALFLVMTDTKGEKVSDLLYETDKYVIGGPMIWTGKNELLLLANAKESKTAENSEILLIKVNLD